jgi:hypothetical protein
MARGRKRYGVLQNSTISKQSFGATRVPKLELRNEESVESVGSLGRKDSAIANRRSL